MHLFGKKLPILNLNSNTLVLLDLVPESKAITCKWVFKKKLKLGGKIYKYKDRLVNNGFTHKKGINYFDTYSPFFGIITIRILIALALIHKLVIHQIDVNTYNNLNILKFV